MLIMHVYHGPKLLMTFWNKGTTQSIVCLLEFLLYELSQIGIMLLYAVFLCKYKSYVKQRIKGYVQ